MRDPKEQALLERLQAGDEGSLADLAEAYSSKIFQLAFRYLRNKEDAEEITQDVLFKVHRNVGAFRGDEGHEAALVGDVHRVEAEQFAGGAHRAGHRQRPFLHLDAHCGGLGDLVEHRGEAAAGGVAQGVHGRAAGGVHGRDEPVQWAVLREYLAVHRDNYVFVERGLVRPLWIRRDRIDHVALEELTGQAQRK